MKPLSPAQAEAQVVPTGRFDSALITRCGQPLAGVVRTGPRVQPQAESGGAGAMDGMVGSKKPGGKATGPMRRSTLGRYQPLASDQGPMRATALRLTARIELLRGT